MDMKEISCSRKYEALHEICQIMKEYLSFLTMSIVPILVKRVNGPRHTPNPLPLSPQTPQKRPFFWGVCTIKYFFNFGETTMIQNMTNIKSKFRIDPEYFS